MLVGQTGSGKSVCWRILQGAMTRMKRDGEPGYNVVRVRHTLLDIRLTMCSLRLTICNDLLTVTRSFQSTLKQCPLVSFTGSLT
jgi:hypothetical protein